LKAIPGGARRICILNQADTPELQSIAGVMALSLLSAYQAVLITSLSPASPVGSEADLLTLPIASQAVIYAVHEPVAAVVLAAGASRRLGQPKQLLYWRGQPLLRHVAEIALRSGLDPVIVVTGAGADQVEPVLGGLPVQVVRNEAWQSGQSSSIRAGLTVLPQTSGGAVFILADQPNLPPGLIRALVDVHRREMADIAAPLIDGRRGNPVLFDRRLFADLTRLQGDTGGRELFARYPVSWVPWIDPRPLADIDTLADYQRLLAEEDA
jgi:molybdenum cofactor cytidylyltransferase